MNDRENAVQLGGRQSQLTTVLDAQSEGLKDLQSTLATLEQRLNPVLRSEPARPVDDRPKETAQFVDLAQRIASNNNGLEQLLNQIVDILKRLEV